MVLRHEGVYMDLGTVKISMKAFIAIPSHEPASFKLFLSILKSCCHINCIFVLFYLHVTKGIENPYAPQSILFLFALKGVLKYLNQCLLMVRAKRGLNIDESDVIVSYDDKLSKVRCWHLALHFFLSILELLFLKL